jgi:hypothetical protein
MTASVSIWIYGDGSGNNLRLCARDTDNDLFVNTYVPISFTGWQQLIWATVNSNSSTALWVKGSSGDSTINGPNLKLDSIQLSKVGSNTSGHIYFDDLVYMTTGGGGNGKVAGVKYDGSFKLLYLGFPFESIIGQSSRDSLMQKSLYFLNLSGVPVELTGFSSE